MGHFSLGGEVAVTIVANVAMFSKLWGHFVAFRNSLAPLLNVHTGVDIRLGNPRVLGELIINFAQQLLCEQFNLVFKKTLLATAEGFFLSVPPRKAVLLLVFWLCALWFVTSAGGN